MFHLVGSTAHTAQMGFTGLLFRAWGVGAIFPWGVLARYKISSDPEGVGVGDVYTTGLGCNTEASTGTWSVGRLSK